MKKLQVPFAGLLVLLTTAIGCKKELNESTEKQSSLLDAPTATVTTTTVKYVKVNLFSGSNAYSNAEWNNWNTASSLTSAAFKYSDGAASTIKAALSGQSGVSDNGTTYSPTMAPKEVIRYASYSTANRTLTLSGLDNAKTYDLELYASRSGVSNNTTRFTFGSTNVDVKTDNNLANKATFTALKPTSGQIAISVAKLNTYNYINGFTLSEKTGTTSGGDVVPPPVDSSSNNNNTTTPAGSGKVYTLTTTTGEIYIPDASTRGWKGGDTLSIPAGSYSLIAINNFKGENGLPIVIINKGGVVRATQIRLTNAAYFKLTGTGYSGATYGIQVSSSANAGVAIATAHHVEVNNIDVTGTEVGFYFKKEPSSTEPESVYPNYVMSDFYIHHNYIHDVHGEGMYIGHTYPAADPYHGNLIPIRMDRVEIAYNKVDGTDWDGIQLSNARTGAKIHHNDVSNFGRINKGSQQAGIILGGNTNGDIYNNTVVSGTGNGIEAFGYGTIRIYNNTVDRAGVDGTATGQESVFCNDYVSQVETNPNQQILFYNNTIKAPQPRSAIRVAGYNNVSNPAQITTNKLYITNPPTDWLSKYVICNVAGSTISGNTVN